MRVFVLEVKVYLAEHLVLLPRVLRLLGHVFISVFRTQAVRDERHEGTTASIEAVGAAGVSAGSPTRFPPTTNMTPQAAEKDSGAQGYQSQDKECLPQRVYVCKRKQLLILW